MEPHPPTNNDVDSRKKRDSRAVMAQRGGGAGDHKDASSVDPPPEQSKKLRSAADEGAATTLQEPASSSAPATRPGEDPNLLVEPSAQHQLRQEEGAPDGPVQQQSVSIRKNNSLQAPLDLEIALQRVVRMSSNTSCTAHSNTDDDDDEDASKEYLSPGDCWVDFRTGHAGDASALASCYQESRPATEGEGQQPTKETATSEEDTTLEVRLAEGLGDEDTPPAIFALIADVTWKTEPDQQQHQGSVLGAAALVSMAWNESRVLNVEWLYVSKDPKLAKVANLLERRMWLRLSALALMTSCQTLVAPKNTRDVQQDHPIANPDTTAADQQRCDTSSDRV